MITEPDGRRVERALVRGSDPGVRVPAYAPAVLPRFGFWYNPDDFDPRFVLHLIRATVLNTYIARCGKPSYALPAPVQPTSAWLVPCEICFPGGVVG